MKYRLLLSPHLFLRCAFAGGLALFAACHATAETVPSTQVVPSETRVAAAADEDRGALLARLTRILNYGSDRGGLRGPGKDDAVIALGLIRDERAVPVLVDHLLNEESNSLRLQIVRALGWIGSPQAVPALEQALQDKYPYVRKHAAEVLKQITGREYEYDKTGLPDPAKILERIRASAKESS